MMSAESASISEFWRRMHKALFRLMDPEPLPSEVNTIIEAIGIPLPVLEWCAANPEAAKGLAEGRAKVMYREPSKAQKEAAFGPIMEGGRGGPITSDYIRQQAAIGNYQSIWDAAND